MPGRNKAGTIIDSLVSDDLAPEERRRLELVAALAKKRPRRADAYRCMPWADLVERAKKYGVPIPKLRNASGRQSAHAFLEEYASA